MKAFCFSDVHLDHPSDLDSNTLDLFVKSAEWLAEQIRANKPDVVVNLGDTNHRDGGMSTGTIQLFVRFMDPIITACDELRIPFVTIVGNHDQYTRNGEQHVIEPLKWKSKVVDKPVVMKLKGGIDTLFMPYFRSVEEFHAGWEDACSAEALMVPDLVFMHMDVVGAKMNSGIVSTHGITPGQGLEIWNGHYHLPHEIENIGVIGALQYSQFRDVDTWDVPRRGAVLLTKQKGKPSKIKRLANPHTNFFWKIKGDNAATMLAEFRAWIDFLHAAYDGQTPDDNKLNVWFVGPAVEVKTLEESSDWSGYGQVRFTSNDKLKSEETTLTLDLAPEKAVRQYAAENKCSCNEPHDVEIGVQAIRQAEEYNTATGKKRNVVFRQLAIQDFMRIGEAELNLKEQGLTLIEGINHDDPTVDSNESGKSSIAEALLWCLFDKTSRGIGKDDVIRRGATEALVELHLDIDDESWSFQRKRSKGKQTLRIWREYANADGDFDERKEVTPHDQREATAMIEKLIGISFDQFLLLVVMAQGFDTKFSSLNDNDRKELLESFLGLEVYDRAKGLLVDHIRTLDGTARKIEDREINVKATFEAAQRNLHTAEASKAQAALQSAEERGRLETEITQHEAHAPGWREALQVRSAAAQQLEGQLRDLRQQSNLLQRQLTEIRTNHQTHSNTLASVRQQLTAYSQGAICQTCQQPLPAETVQNLLNGLRAQEADVFARIEGFTTSYQSVSEQLNTVTLKLTEAEQQYRVVSDDYNGVRQQFAAYEATLRGLRQQHERLAFDSKHFDTIIEQNNGTISSAQQELASIGQQKIEYERARHQAAFWQDAFEPTGIRSHILRTVVNYINEYLYELSHTLTGGTYVVQLSSTKELKTKKELANKLELVFTPENEPYKAGSGGRRRKVDLMLNLAVARLAKQTSGFASNLLIADEVLDNLDLTASQHVLQMFDGMVQQGVTILLISHNPAIKSMIPNVWTVVRKDGVSEVRTA